MMKILLLATIATSAILASCTQLNADEQGTKLRNQGCYEVIDQHKAEREEAYMIDVYNLERYLVLQYRWNDGIYSFRYDRLEDVCIIEIDY